MSEKCEFGRLSFSEGKNKPKMSFVDLASLTMHRRNELEARIHVFHEQCDRAMLDINKLKQRTQGLVGQLNCDPSELKERFLSCMKQLDEYMYLITDFNLAISKIDETGQIEHTPVHDTAIPLLPTSHGPFNLMDALSEPVASTSTACPNKCPPEKPRRVKSSKQDQTLIVFSSSSSSEENVQVKSEVAVQCEVTEELHVQTEEEPPKPQPSPAPAESNLPAQTILEVDQAYRATIMHIDGAFFWVITGDADDAQNLMLEMTQYYLDHHTPLSLDEVKALIYCAFYDDESECYYRALFLKLTEGDVAQVFLVDTGEMRSGPASCVQPLHARFSQQPPFARCCYLAGVDLMGYNDNSQMEKQQEFMRHYVGTHCTIEVDDNTSESFGVFVVLPSGETLNNIVVQRRLAVPNDKQRGSPSPQRVRERRLPSPFPRLENEREMTVTDSDTLVPEYDDPVEAVTIKRAKKKANKRNKHRYVPSDYEEGYRNRDEADICKHYKGGPEKTCFKGSKCTKKHIKMHPDGWTLDKIEVMGKCKGPLLPAPDTWHKVVVTCVCHYDRVFVHVLNYQGKPSKDQGLPSFGVVMPPMTLQALLEDMNSPATRIAYKPLTVAPALGELVAALYPIDGCWYRAKVMSVTRADQSVEVMYIDYGTVLWVKEDLLRCLPPRALCLPAQATPCVLAGVCAKSRHSRQWAQAKEMLSNMVLDKQFDAHVVARGYDEVTVELFDVEGYSVAEQLAALNVVELVEYSVVTDEAKSQLVVP